MYTATTEFDAYCHTLSLHDALPSCTGLFGWQRLGKPGTRAVPTVQQMLEEALSSVADALVDTVCAGRTDAGVHARCQVDHFDSDAARSSEEHTSELQSLMRISYAVFCLTYK